MRKLNIKFTLSGLALLLAIWYPATACARNVSVDCSGATPRAFRSLQAAINSLDLTGPHYITLASAPCTEDLQIVNRQRLTIDAPNGSAFIISPEGTNGDAMTISGSSAITLIRIGFANSGRGLVINRNSEVNVAGCTVDSNANTGVRIEGNSTVAFSGFSQNNGAAGLSVLGSSLQVADSIIRDNRGQGISLDDSTLNLRNTQVYDNHTAGVVFRRSHGIVGGSGGANDIHGNVTGLNFLNGSSGELIAPNSVRDNSSFGVNIGEGSSVRFLGDVAADGSPLANTIQGNAFIGVNLFGGQAIFDDANQILDNGANGQFGHAGISVSDNATLLTSGSGDIQVSNNTGPGVEAIGGGNVDLTGTVVSNNSEDGIRALGNSQVLFFPPNTNQITGNGQKALACDATSVFFGDATGVGKSGCQLAPASALGAFAQRHAQLRQDLQ